MSEERFDELSKAIAATTSRRHVLKLVGAGVVGTLFSGFFARRAGAESKDCLPADTPCSSTKECCGGKKVTPGSQNNEKPESCCCRFPKDGFFDERCLPHDVCIALGGVCLA
jgi:hypothetical protein